MTPAEGKRRLGIPPDSLTFGFLGRVQPYKGLLDLVSAFRKIAPPDARLVIAGKTSGRDSQRVLLDAIGNDERVITRLEYVPDVDIQLYLNALDVAVFPFRDVLTSSSVLLAMTFGKPVIAPALGCIPETITEAGGILYSADDANGLGSAIGQAARRRSELSTMGERNRRQAGEWTWDRMAAETIEVYNAVIGRSANR